MKKKYLLLIFLSIVSFASVLFLPLNTTSEILNKVSEIEVLLPEGLNQISQNSRLTLYADSSKGNIVIEDKSNNSTWSSNPLDIEENESIKGSEKVLLNSQLIVQFADVDNQIFSTNTTVGSINRDGITYELFDKGIKFIYDFTRETEQFIIPIKYTLEENYLKAEILTEEILEYGNTKILTISFLPFFGAGSSEDNGYLFVPDGSGAIINFNNGKQNYSQYSEEVYGREPLLTTIFDREVKQRIHLPVFGAIFPEKGIVNVIHNGDFHSTISANVSGSLTSYNNINSIFRYRDVDTMVLSEASWSAKDIRILSSFENKISSYEVRFYPLETGKNNLSGIAEVYRQYLIDEKGLKKKSSKDDSVYIELVGAVKDTSYFLGIPRESVQPLTTYSESKKIISELIDIGVRNVAIKYSGWNKGGLKDKVPTKARTERKLGTKNEFESLLAYSDSNNVNIYPDIEFLNIYKSSFGYFKFNTAARTISKSPVTLFSHKINTFMPDRETKPYYLLTPLRLANVVSKFAGSFKNYNIDKLSTGSLGNLIYSDYKPGDSVMRQVSGELTKQSLKNLNNEFKNLMIKAADAYALPFATHIIDAPMYSSRFDVSDEEVPFYQMVIHGWIPYSSNPINLAGDIKLQKLKMLQTASIPFYIFTGSDSSLVKETEFDYLYSTQYNLWIKSLVSDYKLYDEKLDTIGNQTITGYDRLDENVYRTSFEDGSQIIVNYSENTAYIDDFTIPGMDFLILKGDN